MSKYVCTACEESGKLDNGEWCPSCDGLGVTAFDCVACGRVGIPIAKRGPMGYHSDTVCEPCGDRAAREAGAVGA
jgi:RecJ-like exonuclease